MNVGRFKELIKELSIPDSAEIFVCADHGQREEKSYEICPSRSEVTYGEEMIWECKNFRECYDEWALQDYNENDEVTAVCISS